MTSGVHIFYPLYNNAFSCELEHQNTYLEIALLIFRTATQPKIKEVAAKVSLWCAQLRDCYLATIVYEAFEVIRKSALRMRCK